jgi:NAD(P)-dependent dehydrogenase (short-subunit alcohol dehydrogenase family)
MQQRAEACVTIGSVQEIQPHQQMIVYAASKAAQVNMVKPCLGAKSGVTTPILLLEHFLLVVTKLY